MIDLRPSLRSMVPEVELATIRALQRDCVADPSGKTTLSAADRARSAERLAHLAFAKRDRRAWESVQAVIWQLMRRENFRPLHPSDTGVLGTLFESEDQHLSVPALPASLSDDEFCDRLDSDLAAIFAKGRFDERILADFTAEDWQFVFFNFVPSGWDFTRIIALAAVQLPLGFAVPLYENLFDEGGRGGELTPHRMLFGRMLGALGAEVPDLDRQSYASLDFLDRVVPEAVAEINLWCRMLWSRHPGGAIGALYSVEASVPSYFMPLEQQLRRFGLDDDALEYIIGHQETDVEHASQWRTLVKELIAERPAERAAIYKGALLSASWDVTAWQTTIAMWHEWRAGKDIPNIGAWLEGRSDKAPAPSTALS
ncbi:MAG: hypothetical protein Tsb0020_21890 [Haliangiales bacterium]